MFYKLEEKTIDEIAKILNLQTKPQKNPCGLYDGDKLVIIIRPERNLIMCTEKLWEERVEKAGFEEFKFH